MNDSPRPTRVVQPLIERLLLRSRFGRRLLFLFMICALVPTCAVAFLSFRSVSEQLTEQSRERLAALASAAGKTLYDRLSFLENDLRKVIPRLRQCKGNGADSASRDCGEGLLYAVEALARISGDSTILMVGEVARVSKIDPTTLPDLESGQSVVIAQAEPDDYGVYIVHRPADSPDGSVRFVARIDPSYLWSPADEEALPGTVDLSLWDPSLGMLVGSASLSKLSPDIKHQIANTPRGTVEWPGANGASVATWWSLPETRRFRFPAWRVLLSEPQADVLAPMAAFSRTFPLLLTFALLMVLVLGVSQIRRSLVPLAELSRGTRRIADRDFETPVNVSSGDELQELAGAFNGMTLQLGRQFRALKTAAEIDRAVLSSVDTATIVQTVLDRVPEIVACESISMMLLEPGSSSVGTTWIGLCGPSKQTKMATVLTPDDIKETRRHPERLVFGREDLAIPEYLAHFRRAGEPVVVEAYPLGYGGELIGVLAVRRKSGDASEEETVQVRRLADQVAVALSNARMVDQVRFLAFYDSLTRLPNRVLYKERLAQALVRAERSHKLVAVCFLDLDHFSRINDTLGHDLGDVLLKEVAARLVACSRPGDSVSRVGGEESVAEVSRLGGDEFTVILPDITDPQDAVRVARRLLEAFRQPLRLGTQEVFVTTSVGVAIYPFDGADTEELLKSADVAMYHAKEQGRNTYQLYSSSMNAEAMARMQLESQLRKAVESGEFTIWYQPIMDLKTGMPIGAEALVRWAHPERGLVSPGEFISLCEECGLIVPLGEWILRTVCTQAKAWEDVGIGPMRMCVNLSARQLRHDGIVDTVRNIVRETGIQPGCLELELTESMLMEPAGVVGRTIRELADLGVSLAIDDFGTGYSSLSYLKNFPVKTLKIDRTFIMNLTTDSGNAAITTAIIALAGAMGLEVVAEGVETAAQADFLRERGCHRGQGYLFGKPLPVIEFENYLRGETPVKAGRMPAVAGASA